ncbi:MAG: hypothetical protein ACI9D5_001115 [Candidatus Endobugula sp.]|jgi:hypothetical protein
MGNFYILQNQQGYFLKKNSPDGHKEWGDGQEPRLLFRTTRKDEAVNMLFETNSQNVELRISINEYPSNGKNQPLIPDSDLPPPLPKNTPTSDTSDGENKGDLAHLAEVAPETTSTNV